MVYNWNIFDETEQSDFKFLQAVLYVHKIAVQRPTPSPNQYSLLVLTFLLHVIADNMLPA